MLTANCVQAILALVITSTRVTDFEAGSFGGGGSLFLVVANGVIVSSFSSTAGGVSLVGAGDSSAAVGCSGCVATGDLVVGLTAEGVGVGAGAGVGVGAGAGVDFGET